MAVAGVRQFGPQPLWSLSGACGGRLLSNANCPLHRSLTADRTNDLGRIPRRQQLLALFAAYARGLYRSG